MDTSTSFSLDATGPPFPSRSAFKEARCPADIRRILSTLQTRENELTTHLDAVLDSLAELDRELNRLDSLHATVTQAATVISTSRPVLTESCHSADWLSSLVRALDLEKSRVEDAIRIVAQVAELKACIGGVVGNMGAPQDWDAAAAYIARAGQIPDEIVNSEFAKAVVPTAEAPEIPAVTLETARESLCGLFRREFEKAVEAGDDEGVTRFFKRFPLIGREDTGLELYGRFVCQGVANAARAAFKEQAVAAKASARRDADFFHARSLTRLFEHVAQIVEEHKQLVERHYGTKNVVRIVERLQIEVDIQGGSISYSLQRLGTTPYIISAVDDIMLHGHMHEEYYLRPSVQNSLPPENKVISFIAMLNSLDITSEYLARIVSCRPDTPTAPSRGARGTGAAFLKEFPFENDAALVADTLQSLNTSVAAKISGLLDDNVQIIFSQVIQPRLRSVLDDTFHHAYYTLTEEEFVDLANRNDEGRQELSKQVSGRFERGWGALVDPLARIMTPKTFAILLEVTARYLSRVLEKRVWSYAGRISTHGATRMERDLENIVRAATCHKYSLRRVFDRIKDILVIANMEEDEWEASQVEEEAEGIATLSQEEERRARNLVKGSDELIFVSLFSVDNSRATVRGLGIPRELISQRAGEE